MRRRRPDPAALAAPEDARSARLAALTLLNRRDYASAELASRLEERGFAAATAEAVVAALVSERLVDDDRYAGHFVTWHAGRGQGPLRIAQKLREAGMAADLIAASVDAGAAEWKRRCVELRRKRFGAKPPADWKERGRQGRFLSYRGFSGDQVRAALGTDVDFDE